MEIRSRYRNRIVRLGDYFEICEARSVWEFSWMRNWANRSELDCNNCTTDWLPKLSVTDLARQLWCADVFYNEMFPPQKSFKDTTMFNQAILTEVKKYFNTQQCIVNRKIGFKSIDWPFFRMSVFNTIDHKKISLIK